MSLRIVFKDCTVWTCGFSFVGGRPEEQEVNDAASSVCKLPYSVLLNDVML